jgi:Na+/melibiose symporter-like transporter
MGRSAAASAPLSSAAPLPAEAPVPLRIKLAYGAGSIADGAKNGAFNAFLLYYYTAVLGLPGTLSGLAIFVALCVDAITDPLVGSISDNFESRWGRRHPFMYAAAIPMGLCFYGLFAPPAGLGENGLFVWLTTFSIGVRLFLTFYMVPSGALAPEMTTHYDERTSLVSYRWMLGWMGSLAITASGWFYFFRDSAEGIDGRLEAANYPGLGLFACVLVASAILISSRSRRPLSRSRSPSLPSRSRSLSRSRRGARSSVPASAPPLAANSAIRVSSWTTFSNKGQVSRRSAFLRP